MVEHAWRILAGVLVMAIAALGGGCADSAVEVAANGERYAIVCTVSMVTDIVRQVAGDRANVTGLLNEGTDPHTYSPTRSDVIKLMEADVVFYNGLMLEGKMADVFVRVARKGKRVYAVTDKLQDEGYVVTDEADHYDPHVWMDVAGWMKAVRAVAEALSEYDAAGTEQYSANAERYVAELEKLDAYAREAMASIPQEQRVLVTAHDAFSYFGRAYDIEVRGIQGISTESEAGLKDLNTLVSFLVERRIGAVFVETSVADKYVNALIEGAQAKGHTVVIGGRLFSDAMGRPGTYEGTYIGMIDHNVTTVARGLGGNAPQRGMQGKLGHESH
jgi:manganese/zinc/iron transport system substrate-binding protein